MSDVHLSQAHPDDERDPLWMRYRRRAFHPDAEFAALVDRLLADHGDDAIELVFNGDVLDFDAPWVKGGESSFDEVPPTDADSAAHVKRILADHTTWFGAAARLLARGHRVLFMSGNHDVELCFPGVRAAIREELARLARLDAPHAEAPPVADDVHARVVFRTWFHVTGDRVYLEHGSQYDVFNNWRHATLPLTREHDAIHPNLGKLAFRRTGSRMGYFNPYYEETFYISPVKTLFHFLRFYAFGRRHIARTFASGAFTTLADILHERSRYRADHIAEANARAAEETGAPLAVIEATHALGARPAEATMLPIARELWVDRIAYGALSAILALAALAVGGALVAAIVIGVLLVAIVVYEIAMPKPDIRTYDSAPPEVTRILDIHGVRAMCLGHTHRPFGRWDARGRFYGNSGSWCPGFLDPLCEKPVLDGRPFLWLTTEGARIWGGLHWWRGGAIVADAESSAVRDPASAEELAA